MVIDRASGWPGVTSTGATLRASGGPDCGSTHVAWAGWSYEWHPHGPGRYELCCAATDETGRRQPLEPEWNTGGYCNNAVQRVAVTVRARS